MRHQLNRFSKGVLTMPLYEDRRNAENYIAVSDQCKHALIAGTQPVINALLHEIKERSSNMGRPILVAFDGWYGIEWDAIMEAMKACDADSVIKNYWSASQLFQSQADIAAYKKPYITEDPGFGFVNSDGHLEDLLSTDKVNEVASNVRSSSGNTILYGCGAATECLKDAIDMIVYFDKTRQPVLWQMWENKLVPFGADTADPSYGWKEYYYCDYYLLDRQKEYLYDRMDFWVEAISADDLKLLPQRYYDEIIRELLCYPIKNIKIYQPGPWGAYRYRDLFDVPGLECNAWNELAGPELGMIVDLGDGNSFEMPMLNLMKYQERFLGAYLTKEYPSLFPMDVWLDDGYFPEKTPIERTAMPIHNHPSTDYIKRHFNEPLGRYETYYICEAYEGACTIMGYKDNADLEEWERVCRDSNNLKRIEDWKNYFSIWDSNVGDLYLIPPGTAHGHGGNQMVLEMDTCPSVSATEYSFFEYDFARNNWDDDTKTMTAPPLKMHLEHAFDNEKWRRESWVKEHLLAKPKVKQWTKDYQYDRYATVPEMPFDIDRFHFYTSAVNDTQGAFAHIVTLTIGKKAIIRSKRDGKYQTEIELFQSAVIPADFGEYEMVSTDGGFCEVVLLCWKKG